jgi:hypothetical protein
MYTNLHLFQEKLLHHLSMRLEENEYLQVKALKTDINRLESFFLKNLVHVSGLAVKIKNKAPNEKPSSISLSRNMWIAQHRRVLEPISRGNEATLWVRAFY